MSYLINSSPAETTCGSCHRHTPSIPSLCYLAFGSQIRQWATASGVSVETIGSRKRAGAQGLNGASLRNAISETADLNTIVCHRLTVPPPADISQRTPSPTRGIVGVPRASTGNQLSRRHQRVRHASNFQRTPTIAAIRATALRASWTRKLLPKDGHHHHRCLVVKVRSMFSGILQKHPHQLSETNAIWRAGF